jgi:hypothetical protein
MDLFRRRSRLVAIGAAVLLSIAVVATVFAHRPSAVVTGCTFIEIEEGICGGSGDDAAVAG